MRDIEGFPVDFMEQFHVQIGQNVKKAREEKRLTQLQLSQAIGHKSVTIISRAEIYYKGQHFNIEHLTKIAYVLEVELCEFLNFPDKQIVDFTQSFH